MDPTARSFSFAGGDALERAKRRLGGAVNVIALGEDSGAALCLSHRPGFVSHDTADWASSTGASYFTTSPNTFGDFTDALAYERSEAGQSGYFYSTAFTVDDNKPVCLRFYLFQPPENLTYPYVIFRRGEWQLFISKNKAELQRHGSGWSRAAEDALIALLDDDNITSAEQAAIDTATLAIYDEVYPLSLDEIFGKRHVITMIPEPSGYLCVRVNDGKFERFEQKKTLKAMRQGSTSPLKIWRTGNVSMRSNGVAVHWQFGRPIFAATGQFGLGEYNPRPTDNWQFRHLSDLSLAGTSFAMSDYNYPTSTRNEIICSLETTDPNVTPLVYLGYAYTPPGVHTGYYDSATYDTDVSGNPVTEMTPNYEGENRRLSVDVNMRNIQGDTSQSIANGFALAGNGLGWLYPAGQHAVCDLYIDGTPVITHGLARMGGHGNIGSATPNQAHNQIMRSYSEITLQVCDMWARLDELKFQDAVPPGDYMRIGEYLRYIFGLAGLHATQYAGVLSSTGRRLPSAIAGDEGWRVQPTRGTSFGEWCRHLLDVYGDGRQLWPDTSGVWQFDYRSTTPQAAFTTGSGHDQFFDSLGLTYDLGDFANCFRVEGGIGPDGLPIVATWREWASIIPPGSGGSPLYIGREIWAETLVDDSLITQSQANIAVRNLRDKLCKPPRYLVGEVFYRPDLFPGDRVTAYGVDYEVSQISGGSIQFGSSTDSDFAGKLSLTLREVG